MEKIKNIYIDDMEELADKVVNSSVDNETVAVIGFHKDMAALVKQILRYENIDIIDIELCAFAYSGYDGEYLLTITDGSDLCVEKEEHSENKYFNYEANVLYIANDCNSSIICHNMLDNAIVYSYGFTDEHECNICDENKGDSVSDRKHVDCNSSDLTEDKSVKDDVNKIDISITVDDKPVDIKRLKETMNEVAEMASWFLW